MLVTLKLKKEDMLKTKIENYPLIFVQNEADKVFRIVTEYGMVEIVCNIDHINGFIKQLEEQIKIHNVIPHNASNENTNTNITIRKAV